jgi:hydroxymethylglutaryl-CoA reductase
MVEHVSLLFYISRLESPRHIFTPEELIEKAKRFLWNEKPFRQNTVGPGLPEEPMPLRFSSLDEAKGRLIDSIGAYYQFFEENPDKKTIHPAFGYLNMEEWERFHYKHIIHHFTQFSLIEMIAPEQV